MLLCFVLHIFHSAIRYQSSNMWQRRWFILDHIGLRYCRNPICPMEYTRAIPIGYQTTVTKYAHPRDELGHCIMIKFDGNVTEEEAKEGNPVGSIDSSSEDLGPRRIILRCDSEGLTLKP
jgi:hypothetical protein